LKELSSLLNLCTINVLRDNFLQLVLLRALESHLYQMRFATSESLHSSDAARHMARILFDMMLLKFGIVTLLKNANKRTIGHLQIYFKVLLLKDIPRNCMFYSRKNLSN